MCCGCTSAEDPPPATPFSDATATLGLADVKHHWVDHFCDHVDRGGGPGACVFDYDSDGDVDLYLTDRAPHPNTLYRNDGNVFVDVTESSGVGDTSDSVGCLAFDYDGDDDSDLLVTNYGPSRLYRNDGGVFADVTTESGLLTDGWSTSATAGDIDGDGDLDVVIARYADPESCPNDCGADIFSCVPSRTLVFENQDGVFVEGGIARGIAAEELTYVVLLIDIDRDGDLDLFLGNDTPGLYPDHLYINDGTGNFTDDMLAGVGHAGTTLTMGVAVGDLDRNGVDDMVITDFSGKPTLIYDCELSPELLCTQRTVDLASIEYVNWGVGLHDFDGDGDLDLFQASGDVNGPPEIAANPNQLFWNDSSGKLVIHPPVAGDPLEVRAISRGVAFGDLDDDGDVDVVVANAGGDQPGLRRTLARRATRLLLRRSAGYGHDWRRRDSATVSSRWQFSQQ
jgi:hypothetical protein